MYGAKSRSYQLVTGLWNPAAQSHSWVVESEFDTVAEAHTALDDRISAIDIASIADAKSVIANASKRRGEYDGMPIAILEVTTKVIERVGRDGGPFANAPSPTPPKGG